MIPERFPASLLGESLLSREQLRPFPPRADRAAWLALPAEQRRRLVATGESALGEDWPALPATLFLEFVRTGNRLVYERHCFPRRDILTALVLAECAEGEGRFLDAILNAAWAICEESFWGISAHVETSLGRGLPDTAAPVVDLFAAETGALMAWTAYLLGDALAALSPQIVPRIHREAKQRILVPCLARDDFWWMGIDSSRPLNNWTPWICSNWLTTALLLETDSEARTAGVLKATRCLDNYLSAHPADGGCDEGPGYWGRAGASTFDCSEILAWATAGAVNLSELPLLRNMGAYLTAVHIDEDRFVNFADASPTTQPNGPLCVRFGLATGNPELAALGRYFEQRGDQAPRRDLSRALPALFATPAADASVAPPHVADAWFPDTQVMTARCQAGTNAGFFLAVKGGHNAESHNHNDVGNVVVYRDGLPVLVDAGVGTYSAKTFSAQRYEIWTMQSAYHNLPTIDGKQQYPGHRACAKRLSRRADAERAELAMDIAPAYPAEAGISSWTRTVTLVRGERVEIRDKQEFGRQPGELEWSFVTACEPVLREDGVRLLAPADTPTASRTQCGLLTYTGQELAPAVEAIPLEDPRLARSWPGGLWRIRFRAVHPHTNGTVVFRLYPR